MAVSDEEHRKLEEIRRKAEEEEERRIEEEVSRRTESLKKFRGKKKGPQREDESRRRKDEDEGQRQREVEQERREEDLKRREEEHRRREEEAERKRREEEERRKAAEEEAAKRRREEEERRKREEAEHRRVEDEERERREEGERQRQKVLKRAEELLAQNEFDRALAETANILAVDPMQAETLAVDQRIRTAKTESEARKAKETQERPAAAEPQIQGTPPPTAPVFPPFPPPPSKPAEEKVPAKERRAPAEEKRPAVPRPPRKPLPKGAIAGAAAAILVVVVGIVIFRMSKSLFEGKRHIAVLPFVSQSEKDEERVLGTALAGEVAAMLSHFPDARIMGPSTAVNLQRTFRDPRAKANQLHFPYTITGTIAATGPTVSLDLDIIDTLGNKMWSGRVERSRERIMELPVELVRTLSDAFEISLPSEHRQLMSGATSSSGAYLAYLRGRYFLHRRTSAATNEALSQFLQATSQDPSFAEAHAAAGHTYLHLFGAGWTEDPGILAKAEESARKALTIRSPLAEARTVLGGVFMLRSRYREGLTELEQAVASLPGNSEAERLLGVVYAAGGNESKALEHLTTAYEFDPANVDLLTAAGLVHQRFAKPKEGMAYFDQALLFINDTLSYLAEVAGDAMIAAYQYDRAIAIYERRVSLDPRNFIDQYKLARAYQLAGRDPAVWSKAFEKTIALIQQELRSRPQNALAAAYLGLAYSRYGRFPEGETNGKKAVQIAPNNLTINYKLADIYSIQKKKAEAISALRQAIRGRYVLEEVVSLDLFNVSEEPEFGEAISQSLE